MVVVTSVMWAGMTSAMGSPKDARQRWSSSAISAGNPRITPMLMPSLRCPLSPGVLRHPERRCLPARAVARFGSLAVTLLTEDIGLADSGQAAGVGQETHLRVDIAQGDRGDLAGLVGAEGQQPVQLRGIVQQLVGPVPDGA